MAYTYTFINADEQQKSNVWNKGTPIRGYSSNVWRSDACGHIMKYGDHGDTSSKFGWEIDHIYPKSLGGSDILGNLQPLFWRTNRKKADNYPWSCEAAAA